MIGHKVVTAHEMARIEGLSFAAGCSEEELMENAGLAVAAQVEEFLSQHPHLSRQTTFLIGKGNNGGDAYVAARHLKKRGFQITAYHFYSLDQCGPLCHKQYERYKEIGGSVEFLHTEPLKPLAFQGIIVDGLVGTGFRGKAEGILAEVIQQANQSRLPILSIDIPSGLNGNTGEIGSVAIRATQTIYLGLPKIGFFLNEGWNCVGELIPADFGLPSSFIEEASVQAYLLDEKQIASLLPPILRTRHKYQAGYLLALAGSHGMSGAALLSCLSALRTGAGIVRLFYPHDMSNEIACAPYELLKESWDQKNFDRIFEEQKRAAAFLMGPGLGRTKVVMQMLKNLLPEISLPCLLDADALYFLSEHPKTKLPAQTILTPHVQEMQRLLGKSEFSHANCQAFVEARRITLVLKGAPTFIFHPEKKPIIITQGDPGMATAGTGDVLSGIIAALLAQRLDPYKAAILGAYLHGVAGEQAAKRLSSYSLIASDLIAELGSVFLEMSINDFMNKKPNKVTEKALKQSKAGKNLKKFDNLEDFFDDLGI